MRLRTILGSTALHAGVLAGAAAWVGASPAPEAASLPVLVVQPSQPAAAVALPEREPVEPVRVEDPAPPPPLPAACEPPVELRPFDPPPPSPRPAEWLRPEPADLAGPPGERVRAPRPAAALAEANDVAPPLPEQAPEPPAPWVDARYDDTRNRAPDYPLRAQLLGHEGTVVLLLDIDARGAVRAVDVESGGRHRELARAAVRAARAWVFEPAREHGLAVASRLRYPVVFRLR